MKRIFFLIATLALAMSCMEKATYTQSGTVLATFEFSGVNYSEMFGEDSLYFDTKYKGGIGWDLLAFYHQVDKETSEFEGGFMMSYLGMPASGETEGLSGNEYRAYMKPVKSGLKNTYMVFNQTDSMPEHDMGFTFVESHGSTGTCVMKSCQVNNTVAVAKAVNEKFEPGNKLVLKAKGYLDGTETATAEIMLAERTTSKDSIVSTWTEFDLSKLGSIDKVDFEILMPEGMDIPAMVCIDNVVANVSLTY